MNKLDDHIESTKSKSLSFKENNVKTLLRSLSLDDHHFSKLAKVNSFKSSMMVRRSLSFNGSGLKKHEPQSPSGKPLPEPKVIEPKTQGPKSPSTKPLMNRDVAAIKLQKTYKGYRTRRNLADSGVLVNEIWSKCLDSGKLKNSSVSFFDDDKPETVVSRWSRARTQAAKVGKGLSKNEKARKLALQHWLEAIDPRHRFGHNLQFYYAKWLLCESNQPFFYWLDVGEGKEVDLEKCPRTKLLKQCIKYLGPTEREAYEVIVEDGKFMYKLSKTLIDTTGGPNDNRWIFVLSPSMVLYIGMKQKGKFAHSSFLAGGATISAGRLEIRDGFLESVWPYSGHYIPTEESFDVFMSFLEQHHVHFAKKQILEDVLSATNNFSDENLIAKGALGKIYNGRWYMNLMNVVVQRLDFKYGQGDELQKEMSVITKLRHKNIASFFGYCDENNEKIMIYQAFHGTLNQHLTDPTLTWSQRLQICLGVARALNHIHYDVIHCDINSSKILLTEDWEPKIYGFELSTQYPQTWRHRLLFSRYFDTNNLTPKYDVYSFGTLLFEVICGRKPMITNDGVLEEVDKIIDPNLQKQMDTEVLALYKNILYNCLNQECVQRPTMDQIVKELEEVLELQWKHANLEQTTAADEGASSNNLKMDLLYIPLSEIRMATRNFDEAYVVGSGGYGKVYKATLDVVSSLEGKCKDEPFKISKTVAIKRIFSRADDQGKQGFVTEIELLTSCKHPNIVSLLGFSREAREMILVYEYAFNGSLSDYLSCNGKTINLTWAQRIHICLDIAQGINYLHTNMEGKPRIIHRDIKSDNILLDEKLNAKVADFGLSKFHPMKEHASTIYTKNIVGTEVYMDPEYLTKFKYKKESDIYSFGVVLFEVMSGRLAYDSVYIDENHMGLAPIARKRFNEGTLKELLDPKIFVEDDDQSFTLNRGPNEDSFDAFTKVAYHCLAETQAKRPTMEVVIKELQKALRAHGDTMVLMRFLLRDILLATENFAETYCTGLDTNGMVYKAELNHVILDIKRITSKQGATGKLEFFEEIQMRACKHPNLVSLCGFCDEGDEMILVYDHASGISLDEYLKSVDNKAGFTWTDRLYMCLEIARGLNHLHSKMINPRRIEHNDIRSAKILLDKKCEAKLASFGISKVHPANQKICMKVYEDLAYQTLGKRKMESDVYSFGVVLFETFCGKVAYDPVYMAQNDNGLAPIASQCFNDGTIWTIIDPCLKEETSENMFTSKTYSFYIFLSIAYKCLGEPAARPTMEMVIMELERALNIHTNQYFPTSIADEIIEEIRSLVGRDINSMRVS